MSVDYILPLTDKLHVNVENNSVKQLKVWLWDIFYT